MGRMAWWEFTDADGKDGKGGKDGNSNSHFRNFRLISSRQPPLMQPSLFPFLATLVALHFTLVSKSLGRWVGRSFKLA